MIIKHLIEFAALVVIPWAIFEITIRNLNRPRRFLKKLERKLENKLEEIERSYWE